MSKLTLRGRKLYADGVAVAEIIGQRGRGTISTGYGYRLLSDYWNPTTRDWPYFDDAVKACRRALARAKEHA